MTKKSGLQGHQRLASIDAFRGLTIFGMILVLNPGSWKNVYPILKHASWHGCTIADLVYPFFLFIVGVSITFSLGKIREAEVKEKTYFKIVKRSLLLFIIGLFITNFPDSDFMGFRILGVLQRIAICYLIVSIIFLNTNNTAQIVITLSLLAIYWAIMELIPLPGGIVGSYEKTETVATYVDKIILKGYMGYYEKLGEPEGIISTLPAIATTLFGVLAGNYLKNKHHYLKTFKIFTIVGIFLTLIGLLWDNVLPINKHLWTSSYSVYTAGLAFVLFALFYLVIDGFNYKKWAKPFIVFGMNAITVYVLSIVVAKLIKMITFTSDEKLYHARSWLYDNVLSDAFGIYGGSLVYALLYCLKWCAIMWIFYNKKIFIKV